MSSILRTAVVVLIVGVPVFAQQPGRPTIPEQVRAQGNLEMILTYEYGPATLEEIAASAEMIVEATIERAHSHLTADERQVVTDYRIAITRTLKGPARSKETAIVRRPGGSMTIDSATVVATEQDFPPFELGQSYVLFLTSHGDVYEVVYGGQGAFGIALDSVTQMSKSFGTWNKAHGRMPLSQFRDVLRKASATGPNR